jgi:RNA-directed DNA polymerase
MKLDTLEAAYLEAKRNGGAPGSDDETFEKIEAQGRGEFLAKLAEELRTDAYHPRPYRRREIPKEGGKVRVISIPAIRDRVVQGALRLILEPIFEADFSDSSYGARPGRCAHEATEKVRMGLRQGRHRVVDVGLSRYFDTIRHDRILAKVARRVVDGNVLAMVKQFLKSTGDRGVPQGSPLSPLLANLALNDLDHALDRGGDTITYARYLDDMVVLAADTPKGRQWADRALERIRQEAGGYRRVAQRGEDPPGHDNGPGGQLCVSGIRVPLGTEPEDWKMVCEQSATTEEGHRNSAGSWGNPAQEPPLVYASGGGAGEPSSAGLGELLPRRQLGACVRQGQVRGRPQGEAIGGQEVQAQGIWLEAVE